MNEEHFIPIGDIRRHLNTDKCFCKPIVSTTFLAQRDGSNPIEVKAVYHRPGDERDLLSKMTLTMLWADKWREVPVTFPQEHTRVIR